MTEKINKNLKRVGTGGKRQMYSSGRIGNERQETGVQRQEMGL